MAAEYNRRQLANMMNSNSNSISSSEMPVHHSAHSMRARTQPSTSGPVICNNQFPAQSHHQDHPKKWSDLKIALFILFGLIVVGSVYCYITSMMDKKKLRDEKKKDRLLFKPQKDDYNNSNNNNNNNTNNNTEGENNNHHEEYAPFYAAPHTRGSHKPGEEQEQSSVWSRVFGSSASSGSGSGSGSKSKQPPQTCAPPPPVAMTCSASPMIRRPVSSSSSSSSSESAPAASKRPCCGCPMNGCAARY